MRVEQALRHFLGRARGVDNAHPLRLLGGDQAEGEIDLLVIVLRAPADAVADLIVAGAGAGAALGQAPAPASGRESNRRSRTH